MNESWCNGRWIRAGESVPVAIADRGLGLGMGLFETLLAVDGRVAFVERHLARLAAGCAALRWLPLQEEFPDLAGVMADLLARNGLECGSARVRLALTGGSGSLADLAAGPDRLVWLTAQALAPGPERPTVTMAPWRRNERGALAGLKCASYAENLLGLDAARRAGCDEVLWLNTADDLCEAATANVFLVRHGGLLTPSLASGCLPGITREMVLELATREGIRAIECPLTAADLAAADEIFLTSATRGPLAVGRVGGRELGEAPVTARIRRCWEAAVRVDISR